MVLIIIFICFGFVGDLRLSEREITLKNWKFVRIMKQSGLLFTEGQLLKIVQGLGDKGGWRQAMSVVEWVYKRKEMKHSKSRYNLVIYVGPQLLVICVSICCSKLCLNEH